MNETKYSTHGSCKLNLNNRHRWSTRLKLVQVQPTRGLLATRRPSTIATVAVPGFVGDDRGRRARGLHAFESELLALLQGPALREEFHALAVLLQGLLQAPLGIGDGDGPGDGEG